MDHIKVSTCIKTELVEESKRFYCELFGAKIVFDCGWYIDLQFESGHNSIQFMSPQNDEEKTFGGDGVVFNIRVQDVDDTHQRFVSKGMAITRPLQNNPWGDRSFSIIDPNGVTVYIYSEIPAEKEFQDAFKD